MFKWWQWAFMSPEEGTGGFEEVDGPESVAVETSETVEVTEEKPAAEVVEATEEKPAEAKETKTEEAPAVETPEIGDVDTLMAELEADAKAEAVEAAKKAAALAKIEEPKPRVAPESILEPMLQKGQYLQQKIKEYSELAAKADEEGEIAKAAAYHSLAIQKEEQYKELDTEFIAKRKEIASGTVSEYAIAAEVDKALADPQNAILRQPKIAKPIRRAMEHMMRTGDIEKYQHRWTTPAAMQRDVIDYAIKEEFLPRVSGKKIVAPTTKVSNSATAAPATVAASTHNNEQVPKHMTKEEYAEARKQGFTAEELRTGPNPMRFQ